MERFSYSRNGWGRVDENCQVRVSIPSLETVNRAVHYRINVANLTTGQTWRVVHRYSEFLKLRQDLLSFFAKSINKCPGCSHFEKAIICFDFPRKHLFNSNTRVVLNYRKTGLRAFLALLASHTFTTSPKCPNCAGFPFESVRDFLTEDNVGSVNDDTSRFSVDQLRESIDVKDFIEYFAPGGRQTVNNLGAFISEDEEEEFIKSSDESSFSKPANNPQRKISASRQISPVPARRPTNTSSSTPPPPVTTNPAPKEAEPVDWLTDEDQVTTKSRKSRSKRNRHRHSKKKHQQDAGQPVARVMSEDDVVLDAFD